MKQRGKFDLNTAANFLTLLFFDINNKTAENLEAMKAKFKNLKKKLHNLQKNYNLLNIGI